MNGRIITVALLGLLLLSGAVLNKAEGKQKEVSKRNQLKEESNLLEEANNDTEEIANEPLIVGGDNSTWTPTNLPEEANNDTEEIANEPIVGGDNSTWTPTNLLEEANNDAEEIANEPIVGGDNSTWTPTNLLEEANNDTEEIANEPLIVGGDNSTWTPTNLLEEANNDTEEIANEPIVGGDNSTWTPSNLLEEANNDSDEIDNQTELSDDDLPTTDVTEQTSFEFAQSPFPTEDELDFRPDSSVKVNGKFFTIARGTDIAENSILPKPFDFSSHKSDKANVLLRNYAIAAIQKIDELAEQSGSSPANIEEIVTITESQRPSYRMENVVRRGSFEMLVFMMSKTFGDSINIPTARSIFYTIRGCSHTNGIIDFDRSKARTSFEDSNFTTTVNLVAYDCLAGKDARIITTSNTISGTVNVPVTDEIIESVHLWALRKIYNRIATK